MWWKQKSDPETYASPSEIPSPDEVRTLTLYKHDACPYCIRIFTFLQTHSVFMEMADTRKSQEVRAALIQLTGRTQVPCLVIDGIPFFESSDILEWLAAYVIRGGKSAS